MKLKSDHRLSDYLKIIAGMMIAICLPFSSLSQSFRLKTYSAMDGLPSPYVLANFPDQYGYLWVATVNGLSRFDGKNFTNYGYSDGLPNPAAGQLLIDSRQRMWFGAKNGIGRMMANKFKIYPLSDSLKSFTVFCLIEIANKEIWATTTGGVYRFENDHWQKIKLYPGYDDHPCRRIMENSYGLYINYGDMVVLQRPNGEYKITTPRKDKAYYYFDLSRSGNDIYISSFEGVLKIEKDSSVKLPGILGNLKSIYSFFHDNKKRAWIGTEEDGLQMLASDSSTELITVYKKKGINLISSISEDKQGNIWVADFEGLVKVYEPGYTVYSLVQSGIHKSIRNIIQLPDQPMLLNDGSLALYTFMNGRAEKKELKPGKGSLVSYNEMIVDQYCVDEKGRPWFSLRGYMLAMLDKNILQIQYDKYAHLGKESFGVLYDKYRKKILTAILSQPYPCQFDDTTFHMLPVKNKVQVTGITRIIHQCSNGIILFSTENGNIFSIDKDNYCREQLSGKGNSTFVSWFLNDPSGDVWIGYNGISLKRYRWVGDSLVLQEELDRLKEIKNSYIVGMDFDNNGNLWIASLSGITILSPGKNEDKSYKVIHSFSVADLNTEISEASRLTKDDKGDLWLSFPDKLMRFYPEKITGIKNLVPSIQVEDVRLDFQQTDWSLYADSLTGIFGIPVKPLLPYDKNSIGIYFKGISSSGTNGIEYSYQLEGLSDNWSVPTQTDFVSFVKLLPGKYTFRVKAKLSGGDWSEPAVFEFGIRKPFWETWWFRTLMLIIASAIIILSFRYRVKQIKAKTEIKHQLLELEMKALKAQMNPHFIYNSLNSIQSLIANDKPKEASHYISQFAKLLRQVLDQSDNNTVSLQRELQTLELYISLESLRLNFEPQYHLSVSSNIQPANEKIPPMILQPFIENSLWHGLSRKEGDKKISLSISADEHRLTCVIEDNGIGREKAEAVKSASQKHESKGMGITLKRLLDFNGDESETPVIFEDLHDAPGSPSGTRITLYIRRMG